jgi:hypothetical protein
VVIIIAMLNISIEQWSVRLRIRVEIPNIYNPESVMIQAVLKAATIKSVVIIKETGVFVLKTVPAVILPEPALQVVIIQDLIN